MPLPNNHEKKYAANYTITEQILFKRKLVQLDTASLIFNYKYYIPTYLCASMMWISVLFLGLNYNSIVRLNN